jgi:hypothetical protein
MPNLSHLLIIWRSPEHHHAKGCLLGSNQKTDEISEAAISLAFISSEYRPIYEQNFIRIAMISPLILDSAVESGL